MLCYACLLHAGCCVTDAQPAQGLVLDIDKNKWWERLPFNPCSATGPSGTAVSLHSARERNRTARKLDAAF
eukprot:gene10080-biopygen4633